MDWKFLCGIAAGCISAAAYIPYIVAVLRGAKPNQATWIIWSSISLIVYFSSKEMGSIETLWILRAYILGSSATAILALFKGQGGWTPVARFSLFGSLFGLLLWWMFNSPLTALLVNIATDVLGAIPTIRDLYRDSTQEDKLAWGMFYAGAILNLFAIRAWTFQVYIYPVCLIIIISTICYLIFIPGRRA